MSTRVLGPDHMIIGGVIIPISPDGFFDSRRPERGDRVEILCTKGPLAEHCGKRGTVTRCQFERRMVLLEDGKIVGFNFSLLKVIAPRP